MSQPNRLPTGGQIDRETLIDFVFNGCSYTGHPGDTVASALLANGVRVVGRSFKYHRPRGIFGLGAEEPNALLQLETGARTLPNHQATRVELYHGLTANSVNCWPNPDYDLMSITGLFHRLIPAGFYYKTFMWPPSFWRYYEYFIRRAAGLGKAPTEPDPDQYDRMNAHADVVVVGAGPSGLAAAHSAALSGARVILADDQVEAGGWLLNERYEIDDKPAREWVEKVVKELTEMEEVTVLRRTTAFGLYDHNFLGMIEQRGSKLTDGEGKTRQRIWRVRAQQVILATGAIERPMIFSNNDRPGVMLASAVRAYLNRYGVAAGQRVAVFTNNDDAYRTAIDLADAGVEVASIIDVRPDPSGMMITEAIQRDIEILEGSAVTDVHGRKGVESIEVGKLNDDGTAIIGMQHTINCDVICSSGGWNPAIHLHSHSGGKARFDDTRGIFLPEAAQPNQTCIGSAAGKFSLTACLAEGASVGKKAAGASGFKKSSRRKIPSSMEEDVYPIRPLWVSPEIPSNKFKGKYFVDPAHDVTAADIRLAALEGYESVEHTKRYTTLGMAPDQGKTGNIAGMAILGDALGRDNFGDLGTTTFRPPYTPVTIGALAGRDIGVLMDPVRMTPIHHWHEQVGCKWEDVGQWKRPWYYPKAGESMSDAVNRECRAARNAIGIMDASTLGKIVINGPDAVEFLNRIYTNSWDSLKIGHCRYGLMLGEDGMVMDDGVTTRMDNDRFFMTTTTGNASSVLEWLEEWSQTEWPDLKVYFTSVTEQYANITLVGPKACNLLAEFTDDMDLSPKTFKFMTVRKGTLAGVPAEIFRISFTGELSYEIYIPASYGLSIWTSLMNAGEKYGITPYGTEAMHVLRAEKGYIIVGQETDGTTTPQDLGMDWIISKKKDFLGRRSFDRTDNMRDDRKQLVGLLPEDKKMVLPEGGQIITSNQKKPIMGAKLPMIGHVTSSYFSANLGRSFALALVKRGRDRIGETVYVPSSDRVIPAKITTHIFLGSEGTNLDG